MSYTRDAFYQRASELVFSSYPGSPRSDLLHMIASELDMLDPKAIADLVQPIIWEMTGVKHYHSTHKIPQSAEDLARRPLEAFAPHIEGCERRYSLSDGPFKYSPSL